MINTKPLTISLSQILLSYALLVTLLATGWYLLISPTLNNYESFNSKIEQLKFNIGKVRAAIQIKKFGIAKLQTEQDGLNTDRYFLSGVTPAIASANLQEILKSTIQTIGGNISNSHFNSLQPTDDLNVVDVSMEFLTDIDSLYEILYRIETNEPFIFIALLSVRKLERNVEVDNTKNISVLLTAQGYMKPSPS